MSGLELCEGCLLFALKVSDPHRFCTLSDLDNKLCVAWRKRGDRVMVVRVIASVAWERSAEARLLSHEGEMVSEYTIYSLLVFASLFWVFLLSLFSCLPNRVFSDLDCGCLVIGK